MARYNRGAFQYPPMTENPENPSQHIIQERVKHDPAIGASGRLAVIPDSVDFVILLGLATLLLP
ncbi:hypothetical protein [Methylocystis sp.]|uniref:hypothetical protein n=1 Tax=Methylocystis sp. TaxID=1911079 RepID=UPI003DA3AE9D